MNQTEEKGIIEVLNRTVTKGTFLYYSDQNNNYLPIWKEYHSALENPLPYPKFEQKYKNFKEHFKKYSFDKAVTKFLLSHKKTPATVKHFKLPLISKIKKPKGQKRTRGEDLQYYKALIEYLNTIEKESNFSKLVSIKSYDLETCLPKYRNLTRKSYTYVAKFFGLPHAELIEFTIPSEMADIKKSLSDYNKIILRTIDILKDDFEYVKNNLFKKDNKIPNAKKWFVDYFESMADRYLPKWKKYMRNPPKPNFEKSYKIFKKFVMGKTANRLGFDRKKYHKLRYEIVPQGVIVLLKKIHNILYGELMMENQFMEEKFNQIIAILNPLSKTKTLELLELLNIYYKPKEITR